MSAPSRKQREIAQRERLVLDVAARLLVERGYLGLTMDRIAAATEYSKGTIYQHFSNKEEILAALALESSSRRVALFERASTFSGRARERLCAVGVAASLFVDLHPLHFQVESIVHAQSIRQKASEARIRRLEDSELACMNIVLGLIRDAVAQGDLELEEEDQAQMMVLGLWSMSTGFHHLSSIEGDPIVGKLGLAEPGAALFRCYDRFLDGCGWRPLARDWDYPSILERIHLEVFSDEFNRLSAR